MLMKIKMMAGKSPAALRHPIENTRDKGKSETISMKTGSLSEFKPAFFLFFSANW
jgi:hypothetical protein